MPKDKPVLRVLFHVSGLGRRSHRSRRRSQATVPPFLGGYGGKVCVRLTARAGGAAGSNATAGGGRRLTAHCSPGGRRGAGATCLGELPLPASWWPPLIGGGGGEAANVISDHDAKSGKSKKQKGSSSAKQSKVAVSVSYSVFEARRGRDCGDYDRGEIIGPEEQYRAGTGRLHGAEVEVWECLKVFALLPLPPEVKRGEDAWADVGGGGERKYAHWRVCARGEEGETEGG